MLISKFTNENIKNRVADMEKEYGITFPTQYKYFLYQYNGGYTPKTKFRVGKISSDIRGFYGIGDVKLSLNVLDLREWLDKNVFPIACDSFGNYIVVGLGEDNTGMIYFCDHEKEYKIEYLEKNLKTFLQHCSSGKINDAAILSIKEREQALIEKGRGNIITDALRQMWQAEIDKYSNMVQEEVVIDEL